LRRLRFRSADVFFAMRWLDACARFLNARISSRLLVVPISPDQLPKRK
jgi:hypothetical protein